MASAVLVASAAMRRLRGLASTSLPARQVERASGQRPGMTSDERTRMKELERENRERKRANEILRKASAFFALGG